MLFSSPASMVYLRFCWLNQFIYVSITMVLMLSLESQQLCQNFSSAFSSVHALGYTVGRFACPALPPLSWLGQAQSQGGRISPGTPWANPGTAILGTILEKQGAQACRGENLEQTWNRGLERLQLPLGCPCPLLSKRWGSGAAGLVTAEAASCREDALMDCRSVLLQLLLLLFKIYNSRSDAEAGLLTEARLGNVALFLPVCVLVLVFQTEQSAAAVLASSRCRSRRQPCASPLLCHQQLPSLLCLLSTQHSPALASGRDCKANNNELQSK